MLPLQLIDSFLLDKHIGQVLLVVFVLTSVGAMTQSQRIVGLNTIVFGLIFIMTPASLVPMYYLFLGLALVVVGPIVYVTAKR